MCRLDLFHALTLGGKELELFEEETGASCVCCSSSFELLLSLLRISNLSYDQCNSHALVTMHIHTVSTAKLNWISSCSLYCHSIDPKLCVLSGMAKTIRILLDTIPPHSSLKVLVSHGIWFSEQSGNHASKSLNSIHFICGTLLLDSQLLCTIYDQG